MTKLKPKAQKLQLNYFPAEIRETTVSDVIYRPMDVHLLKKYFPSLYEDVETEIRLARRSNKG